MSCLILLVLVTACPIETELPVVDNPVTTPDPGAGAPVDPDDPADPSGSSGTVGSKEDILKSLGFNLELGDPVDDYGNDIGNKNPLGSHSYTYMKIDELFIAGADISGNRVNLFDDQDRNFVELDSDDYSSGNTGTFWMNEPKKSVSADVDGDGYDELVTAVFFADSNRIQFKVLDYNDNKSSIHNLDDQSNLATLSKPDWGVNITLKGILLPGILMETVIQIFAVTCGTSLYILDNNFSLKGSRTFEYKNGGTNYCFLRVEAGNLNGDEYADLVVVNGTSLHFAGSYYVFSGSSAGINVATSVFNGALLG